MPEDEKTSKIVEALLPHCRMARINGKWVKGGRYYKVLACELAIDLAIIALGFALGLLMVSAVR